MTPPIHGHAAGRTLICCLLLISLAACTHAFVDGAPAAPEPVLYLNMNEGSGQYALDLSGNGNSGEINDVSRMSTGACSGALFFNGVDSYVSVPFRSINHPEKEITVDLWFAVDSYERQVLVSSYHDGGYRIAFDDGNDLWWTVKTARGDVSVPVQHESIPLHRWHHLAGTYDGQSSKIYLDGILRNVANGTGPIHYTYANNVMLGVDAGPGSMPDPKCNGYFKGGLDEVRIYNRALTYGQVMDGRFRCPQEPRVPEFTPSFRTFPAGCDGLAASFSLSGEQTLVHRIIFTGADQSATLTVQVPKGSTLYAGITDAYGKAYPDSWYFEITEDGRRLTRSIAVPGTINTPADAVISSGNASIMIRYFDGPKRFPASASVTLRTVAPPAPVLNPPLNPIFANPIIVIYTASWATVISLTLVFYWLHRRKKQKSG